MPAPGGRGNLGYMPATVHRPDPAAEPWLASMADALAHPMLVLQADGTVMHANTAARELLERRTPLERDAQGRVRAARPAARRAFAAALQAAADGERRWLTPARDGLGASLAPLAAPAADAPHPVLLALPLPEAPALADFARQHGLNDDETRLVAALMRGERLADVARRLGLGAGALRHRAATLRRKTGQASLLGLVRELARLPPLR